MTDLDRLIRIRSIMVKHLGFDEPIPKELSEEYNTLKAKIEGKIADSDGWRDNGFEITERGLVKELESQVLKMKGEDETVTNIINELNSQVAKLKEGLKHHVEQRAKLSDQLHILKSTLDEIKKLKFHDMAIPQSSTSFAQMLRKQGKLRKLLAKHEDKK